MNGMPIPATYDYRLVTLSVMIAVLASYTALEMAGRITASHGTPRAAWLAGGAVAMGGGIWAMHYTGMLAYRLPIRVYYHVPTVILSLVAAVAASLIALLVVSRPRLTVFHVGAGSLLIGSGIATMHYTGMAAMRLEAMHHYHLGLWLLSIVVAMVIALAAVGLIFYFREENRSKKLQMVIAIVMGLAIPIMHYTGMAAVSFTPMAMAVDLSQAVDISTLASSGIVLVTLVVIGFALLTSLVDRRLTAQANQLALSEQRYQLLFESNPHPTFVFDTQTLLPWKINQAAVSTFGFSREEWQSKNITTLHDSHQLNGLLGEQPLGMVNETQYRNKDGSVIDVEVRMRRIIWEGRPATLLLANDITERKKAGRERDLMEIQLRQAQKLESIGQLAAGIAHEINTPTQYIGDNVHFLEEAFSDLRNLLVEYELLLAAAKHGAVPREMAEAVSAAIKETQAEYLLQEIPKSIQQAREGVTRVATLVQAMKEFSHPGSAEKKLADLNKAIESTITVARSEWKYVAEMETDFDSSLPLVNCLPSEVNQVVLNLIVNAAHAISDVTAKTGGAKGTIRVQTRNCPGCAEIRISDTGGGIPKNVRSRIFEPFFTTKEVGKGTGQGLAIARNVIVDKHQGTIRFETEEGTGTTFIIRLPYESNAAVSTAAHA